MKGELTLKNGNGWKKTLPAALLTAVLTFACVLPMMRHMKKEQGLMMLIMVAIVTYILWRVLFPVLTGLVPGEKTHTVPWTIADGVLTLGEDKITLSDIKEVHCWPNRDALGNAQPGWTVNIEMAGKQKNRVLRTLDDSKQDVSGSEEKLHALVDAMGYGANWKAPKDIEWV